MVAAPSNSEIEETLNLLSNYTDVSVPSRLVFVVGVTGTGKSTLTQFIVRNRRLYAEFLNGAQVIKGDESIGETVSLSFTTRPNLVRDADTSVYFVDCPGFGDTRSFSHDIASTFYTKMLLNGTRELKILAVIDYHSLKSNREGFTSLLRHLTAFLSEFEAYRPSIGLVVTKRAISVDSDEVREKQYIMNHLTIIKVEQARNPDYVRLIELFMRSNGDGIDIFRQPPAEGPLLENPAMVQNLRSLRHLVFDKLRYTKVNPADFRMTISEKTELVVERMVIVLKNRINHLITDIWNGTLQVAELPKKFDLRVANGILNQFRAVSESLRDERDLFSDTELTTVLLRNNFTIQQSVYDALDRQKRSLRLLLDLLKQGMTPHYVDKAQFKDSFELRVHQLAEKILAKCGRSMTGQVKILLVDFNREYEARVAENRDVKLAKRLLKSLLNLKQKIATYKPDNFTVPAFETEMKRCIQFQSTALVPLRDAEMVFLNAKKVLNRTSLWEVLTPTITGYTLSANSSAWQLCGLLNERIDHHVEALSGAVVGFFLAKYRHNDRWFQKRNMKLPLALLEPIIAGEYRSYKSFLKNVTSWTDLYNSSAYTEPLVNLQLLKPDVDYLLNLKDDTVELPTRYKWAKKLQGATGYMRNSAGRPSSPITTIVQWISGQSQVVLRMLDWGSTTHVTRPFSSYDLNSSLLLFDVLLRRFFKTKPSSDSDADETNERWHIQAHALNIVADCEALGGENFDYADLQQKVMRKLVASSSDQVQAIRDETLSMVRSESYLTNYFEGL